MSDAVGAGKARGLPRIPPWLTAATWIPLLSGMLCLMLCMLASGAAPSMPPIALAAGVSAATIGAIAMLFMPRAIFCLFLAACISIPFVLESLYIPLGFMKLYIQDAVFAGCLVLIAARFSVHRGCWKSIPFNRLMMLHFAVGVYALAVGMVSSGNLYDNAFGDFRRSYFYFMFYFVALLLTDNLKDLRLLRASFLVGGFAAIAKGFFEVAAGRFEFRRYGDAAHILSHFELTFLTFVIYYGLARLLYDSRANRIVWAGAVCSGILIILLGNFRACWLSLAAGLAFFAIFLPARKKAVLLATGASAALFVAIVAALMWNVEIKDSHTTLGQQIMAKANIAGTATDTNVTWRFESYANALHQWKQSPILGTGLGEVMSFVATTSTGGSMITEGHRVHNSLLWFFMTLGLIGFPIFLYIQWRYIRTVTIYLRTTDWLEGKVTVLACAALYVSIFATSGFEILMESAMPVTVIASSMALAMLTISFTPRAETQPPA